MPEGGTSAPAPGTDLASSSISHGLYRKALPDRLKDVYERFLKDPDALDLTAELCLLKTVLQDALARHATAEAAYIEDKKAYDEGMRAYATAKRLFDEKGGPPPSAPLRPEQPGMDVEGFAKIVEAIGRAGDRQAARRWTLTPSGAEEVARRIAEAVAGALEGQPPEVIAAVRRALDQVRVPFGAFEGGVPPARGEGDA
jgi:hypothetical protein